MREPDRTSRRPAGIALAAVVLVTVLARPAAAQEPSWTVRVGGGLGVGLISIPRLADYANVVGAPVSADRIDDIQSAGELVLTADVRLTESWSVGFTWCRTAKTLEAVPSAPSAGWTFDATMVMPAFLVRRSIDVGSVDLQIFGGGGPSSGELVQRYGPLGNEQRFAGRGLGLMAGLSTWAPLDDHVAAGISADVRWSGVSRLTDDAGREPTYRGVTASMSWTHLTLQFLIVAQF